MSLLMRCFLHKPRGPGSEEFFALFATDIKRDQLHEIVQGSYNKFDATEIAPIVKLSESCSVLELFHGPTLAFKDFALQFLGNLYEYPLQCHKISI